MSEVDAVQVLPESVEILERGEAESMSSDESVTVDGVLKIRSAQVAAREGVVKRVVFVGSWQLHQQRVIQVQTEAWRYSAPQLETNTCKQQFLKQRKVTINCLGA